MGAGSRLPVSSTADNPCEVAIELFCVLQLQVKLPAGPHRSVCKLSYASSHACSSCICHRSFVLQSSTLPAKAHDRKCFLMKVLHCAVSCSSPSCCLGVARGNVALRQTASVLRSTEYCSPLRPALQKGHYYSGQASGIGQVQCTALSRMQKGQAQFQVKHMP